ncbi:uncharacterized protein LOC126800544 [Argentina anserina]|uniref:uncharacterized protein LOC126800544 n=1 Tax=Argentina anserina TaxID=57926 RepID=UPI0021766CF8|nr:uncharacterized protein LOC126800544 [Potentilla anserina]
MDVISSLQISAHSCFQKLCHAYSFKRSCLFLLLFLLLPVVFLGVVTLIIIFVMKPQKPVFSLQDISVDSYKLNASLGPTLFVSSVITMTLNAQNRNKVGIWYTSSHLEALYDGLPMGTIRIPGFLQPAHSSNVTVETRLLFPCVNASQILVEASLQKDPRKNTFQMKIVGDVGAHLLVFHIILLKIKVGLECDINIDYKELTNRNEVYNTIGSFPASFVTNSQSLFMNCTLALYI